MKKLKVLLMVIYPIIILLLLLNMIDCSGTATQPVAPTPPVSTPTTEAPVEEAPDEELARRADETGGTGDLKVTLLWDFDGDIDLHVVQPNLNEIDYRRKADSSTGGSLDIDNMAGGVGAAENIYWENPPQGVYKVSLVYYQASRDSKRADKGICTVIVKNRGRSQQYKVEMSHIHETKNVVEIIFE